MHLNVTAVYRLLVLETILVARWKHVSRSGAPILTFFRAQVERRGGVVSESDARPEGREFESRPIRDVRLCSRAKHFTTNCPCLLGYDTKNRRSLLPGVYAKESKRPHSGYTKCNL